MSVPPPLPHAPSRSEQMVDAFAHRGTPPQSTPPPRQGMSGCAIAAIIAGALLFFGVFIAGILAAIAMPAYSDYILRSKVAAAEAHTRYLQDSIDAHREDTGECPDNAALGLDDPEVFVLGQNSANLTEQVVVRVGENGKGHCTIELTFANVDPKLDGNTAIFESGDSGWDCGGGTLPSKYRSPQCRLDNTPDNTVSP